MVLYGVVKVSKDYIEYAEKNIQILIDNASKKYKLKLVFLHVQSGLTDDDFIKEIITMKVYFKKFDL